MYIKLCFWLVSRRLADITFAVNPSKCLGKGWWSINTCVKAYNRPVYVYEVVFLVCVSLPSGLVLYCVVFRPIDSSGGELILMKGSACFGTPQMAVAQPPVAAPRAAPRPKSGRFARTDVQSQCLIGWYDADHRIRSSGLAARWPRAAASQNTSVAGCDVGSIPAVRDCCTHPT